MRPDRDDACGLAEDRVLEAAEASDRRFCVGVQWHPEAGEDRRLLGALVGAAWEPGRVTPRATPCGPERAAPRVRPLTITPVSSRKRR